MRGVYFPHDIPPRVYIAKINVICSGIPDNRLRFQSERKRDSEGQWVYEENEALYIV